jgi:PAS domain S-box-containing protein
MQNEEPEKRLGERIAQLEAENARLSHLTSMLDQSQTIVIDLEGTILFWDSGATSLYGWSNVEAIGRISHELLLTEFPQSLADIRADLLTRRWKGELRQRRRDGSLICVASTWSLHYDANGEPASIVKVNTDVTDLRRKTDALQVLEATARSLLENSNQGILCTDRNGLITEANAMVQLLFGYSRAELIGASVEMLVPERFRDIHTVYRENYKLNHEINGAVGRQLVARRKNGSEFAAEISLGYVSGSQGDERYFAYISDITARTQAEAEREELIHSIKQSLAEKTVPSQRSSSPGQEQSGGDRRTSGNAGRCTPGQTVVGAVCGEPAESSIDGPGPRIPVCQRAPGSCQLRRLFAPARRSTLHILCGRTRSCRRADRGRGNRFGGAPGHTLWSDRKRATFQRLEICLPEWSQGDHSNAFCAA